MILDFEAFLTEQTTIKGKAGDYERPILDAAAGFFLDHLIGEPVDLRITLAKLKSNSFGHINLMDTIKSVSSRKFNLSLGAGASMEYNIGGIAHEITHIKQVFRGELGISPDFHYIAWQGKPHTSRTDYDSILKRGDYVTYKSLPWEAEAYHNQDTLPALFKKSPAFLSLRDLSPTMSYIVDMML